jgi:hypothetical protein
LVYGVGNDWDGAIARTLGPNQTMVHQAVVPASGTYWVQARTGPVTSAGTIVQLNDTAPTTDRWNFASVEVVPQPTHRLMAAQQWHPRDLLEFRTTSR